MANRHLSRSIVLQSLFEWDFNGCNDSDMERIIKYNINEFAPGLENNDFIYILNKGILKKRNKLDKIIEKAAPEWPLEQISIVDRNILRIGLYELLFGNKKEVPAKVAINEAIELAKTFGGDSSGKFVNGVLGTVYKETGGEEEERKEMPKERLGGAVVYIRENKKIIFALVHDVFGYWTLSKGHAEENENLKDCTIREIKEELGVDIKLEEELGANDYVASDPEKGKIKKIVSYFLASTDDKNIKLKETGGLDDARWFTLDEIANLKMYDDIRPIITRAVKSLAKKK